MSGDKSLTKDDLVILMESYRNMITMHQTILDQSAKTVDKLDIIATKLDGLFSKQSNMCNSLSSIKETVNKIESHEIESIKNDGKIMNRIYLGWIGMGTIIMGIISTVITFYMAIKPLLQIAKPIIKP